MPMPTLPGIPEQIARYQLLSELGRGSMGHVYLALDPNIDRKVAIKIFLPLLKVGAAEQWELRQRFVFEARAAGQLKHPGIVTIFDADTDPDTGLSYLAMEWVNGPSLDDLIRESGPLAVDRTVAIVEQVAMALDVAHRQGLVHRDIKPANILLESDGRAKVTDFGIAKLASMSITTTGWIPGSPFYMSPEQIRNEGIDRRSDLYALGVVLYQCLTGALPFEAESLAALTHMILEIDPRPVRSVNPAVSADLAAVIDTALAKSPGDRFDSGHEFARALRLAAAGRFRAAAGGNSAAAARDEPAVPPAIGLTAGGGTGTIGLAMGAPDVEDFLGDGGLPAVDDPAPLDDEPEAIAGLPVEPPVPLRSQGGHAPTGIRRLAVAVGVLLLFLVVWSLRPVESGLTSDSSTVQRLFSLAPRFAVDAVPAGARIDAPAQPPEAEQLPRPTAAVSVAVRRAAPERIEVAVPASNRPLSPKPIVEPAVAAREPVAEPSPAEMSPVPSVPSRGPVVRPTSTLELVYRNRLKNASLSVFVDGERVYAGNVAATPNLFKRAVGKNMWTSLGLTPGEHVVDVRVTGAEGKVDLVRQVTATFEDGRTHRLRVSVTPLKKLKLDWKDSSDG